MNGKAKRWLTAAAILVVAVAILTPSFLYVVDEREMAVVLQFGDPVAERTQPGLYFKLPFVQEARKLPRTRQFWGDTPDEFLPDLPTRDDKKIQLVPWAVWRIKDPTVFVQRLRTLENGEQRVAQFVRGAIRDVVTQYDLAELVRSTDRGMHTTAEPALDVEGVVLEQLPGDMQRVTIKIRHGRQKIIETIKQEAQRRLSAGTGEEGGRRGVELIDIGISQIDFVESVRQKTFDRWIAERQAISAKNVNEGERLKQEIINRTAAEVERIEGEGQRQANELRGEVDAEVIRKYAEAIEEAGEFYTFVRTLEAYQKSIGPDTRLIFTTDNEFLRLLNRLDEAPPASEASPVTGSGR
ncbi:MAG: protease modulator HflC [Planctomycetes bacterium]|nr:protease modulator HflC [Planctomycetota bacterium]